MRPPAKSHQKLSHSQRGFRTTLLTAAESVMFCCTLAYPYARDVSGILLVRERRLRQAIDVRSYAKGGASKVVCLRRRQRYNAVVSGGSP